MNEITSAHNKTEHKKKSFVQNINNVVKNEDNLL